MGSLGDRIEQEGARGNEMRTAPLSGLRARTSFLHDGRARTVHEAIVQHEGQGLPSRRRFQGLSPGEQQQLLDFLKTL